MTWPANARFDQAASRESFIDGMRLAATGVTLVTTDGPAGRFGATVSAMASVSADPPSLLVCLHRDGATARAMARNAVFCVNLLDLHHQDLAEVFAGRAAEEAACRFEWGAWDGLSTEAPCLKDALAAFDCRIDHQFEQGSHSIFIGLVQAVRVREGSPLVYMNRSFQKTLPLSGGEPL